MSERLTEWEMALAIKMAEPSSALSYDSTERKIGESEAGLAEPLTSTFPDVMSNPELACLRKELFEGLSEEAKQVAQVVLNCPQELLEHIIGLRGEISRCKVREKLPLVLWRKSKGNKRLIMQRVCQEIVRFLSESGID